MMTYYTSINEANLLEESWIDTHDQRLPDNGDDELQVFRAFVASNPHYTLTDFAQKWTQGNHTKAYKLPCVQVFE